MYFVKSLCLAWPCWCWLSQAQRFTVCLHCVATTVTADTAGIALPLFVARVLIVSVWIREGVRFRTPLVLVLVC